MINADVEMESMSTIKIPLTIEVMHQVKAGNFKLNDKYTLAAADIQRGTGTIQFMDPGAVLTVKDLVTVAVPSIRFAGIRKLEEEQRETAVRKAKLPFGVTPAREMGKLRERL